MDFVLKVFGHVMRIRAAIVEYMEEVGAAKVHPFELVVHRVLSEGLIGVAATDPDIVVVEAVELV